MRAFLFCVVLLLLISACSDADVNMRRENPYVEQTQPEEVVQQGAAQEEEGDISFDEFSLVQDREILVPMSNRTLSITLLGSTNRSAGLLIDGRRFSVVLNEKFRRADYEIILLEGAPASVAVPRKSWLDVSVSKGLGVSQRLNAYVGEAHELVLGNTTLNVSLEFVGRDGGVEKGMLHVGEHAVFAAEKEEEYWDDDLSLYVHNVYFNDASEFDFADGARISFSERS